MKTLLLIILLLLCATPGWATVVDGTNAGFVTTAPTADPSGGDVRGIQGLTWAIKFTAPENSVAISEIGWWCDTAYGVGSNFEVGLFSDSGGGETSQPVNLLVSNRTNARGTTAGWKTSTIDYELTPGTIYWIAVQLDDPGDVINTDKEATGGYSAFDNNGGAATTLQTTWGNNDLRTDLVTFYAVYTVAGGTTRRVILIQ